MYEIQRIGQSSPDGWIDKRTGEFIKNRGSMTAQEAADTLRQIFINQWGGVTVVLNAESIGDSIDGIALCGYEEL